MWKREEVKNTYVEPTRAKFVGVIKCNVLYPGFHTHSSMGPSESVGCAGTEGPLLDILLLVTMKMVSFMLPNIFLLKISPLSLV